jgi:hypothetical protein
MPVHRLLRATLEPSLLKDILDADAGDFGPLKRRYRNAIRQDKWIKLAKGATAKGVMYYVPFVRAVAPQILHAIRVALKDGTCPEIVVTAKEMTEIRKQRGIKAVESPQDVLYGFTSERYEDWGTALLNMGFVSACMSGEAIATVTMASRFLDVPVEADTTVHELEGTIPTDFHDSFRTIFSRNLAFFQVVRQIYRDEGTEHPFMPLIELAAAMKSDPGSASTKKMKKVAVENCPETITTLFSDLRRFSISSRNNLTRVMAQVQMRHLKDLVDGVTTDRGRLDRLLKEVGSEELDGSRSVEESVQEQIVLKYVEEGNFLQKLLGGSRVDHIQSNVKMQKNILRGSKCEVDSIYRVLGRNEAVLVEAKGGAKISRTQLYQLYETFRLRLPASWELRIVAVLGSDPPQGEVEFSKIIDLVEVKFNKRKISQITESLVSIRPKKGRHFRWKIKRQSPTH